MQTSVRKSSFKKQVYVMLPKRLKQVANIQCNALLHPYFILMHQDDPTTNELKTNTFKMVTLFVGVNVEVHCIGCWRQLVPTLFWHPYLPLLLTLFFFQRTLSHICTFHLLMTGGEQCLNIGTWNYTVFYRVKASSKLTLGSVHTLGATVLR